MYGKQKQSKDCPLEMGLGVVVPTSLPGVLTDRFTLEDTRVPRALWRW